LAVQMIGGAESWEPDDPASGLCAGLDRVRVQAADALVQDDPAEDWCPRHRKAGNRGAIGGRGVVVLEDHAPNAVCQGKASRLEVVDRSRADVRRRVKVDVNDAAQDASNLSPSYGLCFPSGPCPCGGGLF
jgi:hypothetical protein